LAVLSGCGTEDATKAGTFFGPTQNVGNGTVRTYVTLDAAGHPIDVGVRMSREALDELPADDTVPPTMTMLDFPDQAADTVFDHVMFNWNSHGHEPAPLFGKPHFDIHFYMTDTASVEAIAPSNPDFAVKAAHLPDAKYVPQDYAAVPGPLVENTVPAMGLHWIDSTAGVVPGRYDFTQIFINGSWDGTYTFMEPMLTREWLETKPTVQANIKQPQAFQKSGYFPTTYNVGYDDATGEYSIALGGMTMHQAS
jgi:hypothetical protein